MSVRLYSHAEQLAGHLRAELLKGRWHGVMPGVLALEKSLGVNRNTIQAALLLLEQEGLLAGSGNGRPRRIVLPESYAAPSLHLTMLPYEDTDRTWHVMLEVQYRLLNAGHSVNISSKSLLGLGMNVERVARHVEKSKADAWVIVSGSREILEWFAAQPAPAFALFGRRRNVPIAGVGPDKIPALLEVLRRLIGLGHRRIVMMLRQEQTRPIPGALGKAFIAELEAHGIPVGDYNLPEWKNTPDGFFRCLDSLFGVTQPTSLIIDEAFLFNVARQYLSRRGLHAPERISLVCTDPDPAFEWFRPKVAHISWDPGYVVRRIVSWSENVARGNEDIRNHSFKAGFVEGETIGRVPK